MVEKKYIKTRDVDVEMRKNIKPLENKLSVEDRS